MADLTPDRLGPACEIQSVRSYGSPEELSSSNRRRAASKKSPPAGTEEPCGADMPSHQFEDEA